MHARAPRARVKISTRTFGQPMVIHRNYALAIIHAAVTDFTELRTISHSPVGFIRYLIKKASINAIFFKIILQT